MTLLKWGLHYVKILSIFKDHKIWFLSKSETIQLSQNLSHIFYHVHKPLQLFVEKHLFFQNKHWRIYIFINTQFTAVFCDNSQLVLKMHFQVFSFASKKVQGFPSDRKILRLLYHCPFICTKPCLSFLKF